MGPQAAAFFAAHKTGVLAGGAAAVAGLALLRRKSAARVPAGATAGATIPGTIPAAAVAGPSAGYDSTSYDVYNALQSELGQIAQNTEALRQTTGASPGAASAPPPVASTLFAPTGSGQLVRYPNGSIAEVESDGSLFGLNPDQWNALRNAGGSYTSLPDTGALHMFTTADNLMSKNPAATPAG